MADQLADIGCKRVAMIGGEVFLRSDWKTIAGRLTSQGVHTAIITNGYQLTETILAELKACSIESVAVSLDSIKSIHDRFRQTGSFDRTEKAIKALSQNGIPVSVISTLHSASLPYIKEFYEYLRTLPIFAWQLQACSPMGNAANGGVDYRFDFHKVIDFVSTYAPSAPFAMGIADNIGYFTKEEGTVRGNLSGYAVFKGCQAGISVIGIDSLGNVRGCESLYDDCFIEGNIRNRTLREIWEAPESFAYNRSFRTEMLKGKCASCPHGIICKAGCRSYNFFVHNELYESPYCPCADSK